MMNTLKAGYMSELLLKLFVPEGGAQDPDVRTACGKLSGITGIILNILLVAGKLAAGLIVGSVAVIGDALNNLSDAASSVITLAGFRLAEKKPDKEHPFGHGRIEYIAGLIISVVIIFMALELGKSSIEKIISPDETTFSWWTTGILGAAIVIKLWMFYFNRKIAKRIDSPSIAATAADSLSDTAATAVVIIAAVCGQYTDFPVDGAAGLLVALFILKTGIGALKLTQAPLLGRPISRELADKIDALAKEHENILGVHDLIYHDYGHGRAIVSFHVEVPQDSNLVEIHAMIDHIEREIDEKFGIEAVIHMDPVCPDAICDEIRSIAEQAAMSIDPSATIHDLQVESGTDGRKAYFDIVIPFGLKLSDDEAKERARTFMAENGIEAQINIDHPLIES